MLHVLFICLCHWQENQSIVAGNEDYVQIAEDKKEDEYLPSMQFIEKQGTSPRKHI